jgi:hypothetical protein
LSSGSAGWIWFNKLRAEAARIAAGLYNIDLDRIPKPYLWRLWRDDVSVWEAAQLCRNVVAAQEGQPDTTKRVKRA